MKTKLTVTVDKKLIPRAKAYARSRGVSLSQLIEDALAEATAEEQRSFSERWRGRFVKAEGEDVRRRVLSEKYL